MDLIHVFIYGQAQASTIFCLFVNNSTEVQVNRSSDSKISNWIEFLSFFCFVFTNLVRIHSSYCYCPASDLHQMSNFYRFIVKLVKIPLPNQNHNWKETVHSMALVISIFLVCELWVYAKRLGWSVDRLSHRLNKNSVIIQWMLCFGVN